MKPATSNLVHGFGPSRPIIKSHPEKNWIFLGLGELPKILGFPCNISAMAEASDFKFSAQLGYVKNHDKIASRRKKSVAPD